MAKHFTTSDMWKTYCNTVQQEIQCLRTNVLNPFKDRVLLGHVHKSITYCE